jgi:hypothetical protein
MIIRVSCDNHVLVHVSGSVEHLSTSIHLNHLRETARYFQMRVLKTIMSLSYLTHLQHYLNHLWETARYFQMRVLKTIMSLSYLTHLQHYVEKTANKSMHLRPSLTSEYY